MQAWYIRAVKALGRAVHSAAGRAEVLLTVTLFLKVYLTRIVVFEDFDLWHAAVLEVPILVAILAAMALVHPKWLRTVAIGMNAFISFSMVATIAYSAYFGRILTPAMLVFVDQLWAVRGSIAKLFHPGVIFYCVDLIVFGAWVIYRNYRKHEPAPSLFARRQPLAFLVFGICSALVVGQAVSASRLDNRVDDVLVARERGLIVYQGSQPFVPEEPAITEAMADDLGLDIVDPVSVQSSIDALIGGRDGERIADFEPGAFMGKNVILIQFESLQRFMVESQVASAVITPNFNELIEQSWYFPNTYSQIGRGNTSDAEFVVNTSLYASAQGSCSELYDDKEIPSMPRIFEDAGYEALTFHTNEATFWNRRAMYKALGFTRFYDEAFFGSEDVLGRFGSSDEVLYGKTLEELIRLDAEGTRFYAQIISLTSHHPFEPLPDGRDVIELPERFDDTTTGDYLKSVAFADYAMGQFIDGLKASGLWDRSVVIVYGDHNGLRNMEAKGADAEAQLEVIGYPYNLAHRTNVPMVIHVPGQTEGIRVDAPAVQSDIMPTIADMLALETSSTPMFGRDLFVDSKVVVPLRGRLPLGSFLNDRIMYVADFTYEDGMSYAANGQNKVRFFEADRDEFETAHLLLGLCDAYLDSLPQLPDYAPDPESYIPTRR